MITEILIALEPNQDWSYTGTDASTKAIFKENFSLAEADWSFTWAEFQTKQSEITNALPLKLLRAERNRRLAECDWTQGADVPNSIKSAWTTYRQALRDITDTYSSMDDDGFAWPTKPEGGE
tara:strand:- start:275 stop:640 length:366 start_codon:yes stop_codon:yes gene_type:complete